MAGEVIDKSCLDVIFSCRDNGVDILGLNGNEIEIVK
jgi:hypothetical protein